MANLNLTYDVKMWKIQTNRGTRRTTYTARWKVAGKERYKTFQTRKLAESFDSVLRSAASAGKAFDAVTGLPESLARETSQVSWYAHAMQYVAMKWPKAAPKSRRGIAEALVSVTPALLREGAGAPTLSEVRECLTRWSFNMTARADEVPERYAKTHAWMEENSLPLSALGDAAVTRGALDALALTLTGKTAAQTTIARKRAVFYGALLYAVELERLSSHPMEKVQWRTPKGEDQVDRRVVINHAQAKELLDAVRGIDPALVAFFGSIYYAALRPAEVVHLSSSDIHLPEREQNAWGEMILTGSTQHVGAWGDDGTMREDLALKHRSKTATRVVPICPELVQLYRDHLDTFGTGIDGRLFVARVGPGRTPVAGPDARPLSNASYARKWQRAREAALTEAQAASPLARRPYDLRHACVSLWLNAGVPATTVADWAGHSVAVLLRVYAKCVDGEADAAKQRVEAALNSHARSTQKPVESE